MSKEVSNPDLLLRRLFISRLAMCNSVCTVLFLSQNDSIILSKKEQILASFDYVHTYDGIPDFLSLLSEDRKSVHLLDKRLKQEKLRRFWGTLEFLEKIGYFAEEYSSLNRQQGVSVNCWSSPGHYRTSKMTSYENSFLITNKRKTKQSFKEGYEDIMTFATMFKYSLADGVIKKIPDTSDVSMYLNLENPEVVTQREINLRSMVFLGYLPCSMNENTDIENLNNRYYSFMKEGRYL